MELKLFFKQTFPNVSDMEGKIDIVFKHMVYAKGTILLRPENFSTICYFVEKGLLRTYFINDGKDKTQNFFDENSFCGSIPSLFSNKPANFGIEVLEETNIMEFDYRVFQLNFLEIIGMKEFENHVFMNVINENAERLLGTHTKSALERYNFMLEKYPKILLRAKLGHIASYLEITPQTLSVIRGL